VQRRRVVELHNKARQRHGRDPTARPPTAPSRRPGRHGRNRDDVGRKAARIANTAAASSKSAVGQKGGKSRSYADWSKADLVKRAKEVGLKGRSTMKKAELVKALRNH
jgi:hypothetical protein